jgi:cell division septum initiation protein DivIVA
MDHADEEWARPFEQHQAYLNEQENKKLKEENKKLIEEIKTKGKYDIYLLKQEIAKLQEENKILKEKNNWLRKKIESIKKAMA